MKYSVGQELGKYKILSIEDLPEQNAVGYRLEHVKTKAKVAVISCDDNNKVFGIGFRTPPKDSTGVPHIIEHTVLCGSKKYPSKDPFVELAKGSLNSFLNAMTYPDKTIYPIASYNDKDFHNLMDVYLDAVFHPNIYKRKEIFKQEGWHYDLESLEGELTYNGVVYNEMKGVFSSPDDQLTRAIVNSLFPNTAYGVESGGDPRNIPELTYEDFIQFHKTYYHPSNSYIYLYGDMDFEKDLEYIDAEYLAEFDYQEINSGIGKEKLFTEPVEYKEYYSVSDEEEEKTEYYYSYNVVIDESVNQELYLAFQILEYALLCVPGAPLKQKLLDAHLGSDVDSFFDNGILQPIFSINIKGAKKEDEARFYQVLEESMQELINKGISKRSLIAAINNFEFKYREANFGRYPKGLMYMLKMYDSWLYDETKPFLHLNTKETFAWLKEQLDKGYFEEILGQYLLNNPHKSKVTMIPKMGYNEENEAILKEELQKKKDSMTKEQLEALVEDTKALKRYQEEPSSKEDIEKIPLLSIEDIEKKTQKLVNDVKEQAGVKVVYHPLFTNGISYIKLSFSMDDFSREQIGYATILEDLLFESDTKNFSYTELSNEILIETGGIGLSSKALTDYSKGKERVLFEVGCKCFDDKIQKAFELMKEIMFTAKLTDTKKIKEIIGRSKAQMQGRLLSSGHQTASLKGAASINKTSYINDLLTGVGYYEFIENLDKNFEEKKEEILKGLEETRKAIFAKGNLIVSYIGNSEERETVMEKEIAALNKELWKRTESKPLVFEPSEKGLGMKTESKVQYAALVGDFKKAGHEYTGALQVLQTIFSYDYLWIQIRVKGGAYGAMCNFAMSGVGYFTSYRDPELAKTYEVYEKAAQYLRDFNISDRDMTKYIIGTIGNIDVPLTPLALGEKSYYAYLSGLEEKDYQKTRDEILSTNVDTIRSLAPYIEAITKHGVYCAVGNEGKLVEVKDHFKDIVKIF
ncbi:MAG: insulinase family protein [Lachnospiraceae bacterium]|nr:insulinase family protein [Lachnospiraceae bacterium]